MRCLAPGYTSTTAGLCLDKPKYFEVGGDRGGLITCRRRLPGARGVGWQFQDGQLRFFVTVEDEGMDGPAQRSARGKIVEAQYTDFFDHSNVAAILGPDLRARMNKA